MLQCKASNLKKRSQDLAYILRTCSPSRNSFRKSVFLKKNTLFLAGALDEKYSSIGKQFSKDVTYEEIPDSGHALLIESPREVARILSEFLLDESISAKDSSYIKIQKELPLKEDNVLLDHQSVWMSPKKMDFELFSIGFLQDDPSKVVWNANENKNHFQKQRKGLLIQISSQDNNLVGVGEILPLVGLHSKSFEEALEDVVLLQKFLRSNKNDYITKLDASEVLQLEGALTTYIDQFAVSISLNSFKKLFNLG